MLYAYIISHIFYYKYINIYTYILYIFYINTHTQRLREREISTAR